MGDIFSGGQEKAYDDLQQALEEAEDQEKHGLKTGAQILAPEIKMGQSSLEKYFNAINRIKSPVQAISGVEAQFAQTPAQQFQTQQALDIVNNAMAAMGMEGTPLHQQMLTKAINGTLGQQEQQFLSNVGRTTQTGLMDILREAQPGLSAASQLARGAFRGAQSLAGLTGQIGEAQASSDIASSSALNKFLSMIGGGVTGGIMGHAGLFGPNIGTGTGIALGLL